LGAIAYLPGFQQQQHFLVPAINLDLDPGLEINLGFGFGMTQCQQRRLHQVDFRLDVLMRIHSSR
jgi:hypothetical protein